MVMVSSPFVRLVLATAAALVVLLIACANLAALYVSVFESRRAELTTRMALGAGIPQLIRQFAFESLVLAGIGGGLGMLASQAALAAVPAWLPANVPFLTAPALDRVTGLFGAVLSVVAGVGCAAWPIARVAALAPMPRAVAWPQRHAIHRVVVASQVALTMGLVPVAALLGQSLRSVETVDPGVIVDRMFLANVGLPGTAPASPTRIAQAEQALLAAVAARPNVIAAAVAYDHPFEANWSETPTVVGEVASASDDSRQAELRIVSPGYFEALGVRLLAGRTLTPRDSFDAAGVALVNEAFAREMDGRVIGRRLRSRDTAVHVRRGGAERVRDRRGGRE